MYHEISSIGLDFNHVFLVGQLGLNHIGATTRSRNLLDHQSMKILPSSHHHSFRSRFFVVLGSFHDP